MSEPVTFAQYHEQWRSHKTHWVDAIIKPIALELADLLGLTVEDIDGIRSFGLRAHVPVTFR